MTDKPTNRLFGRKWKIIVADPSGNQGWNVSDSDWSNDALNCRFTIQQALGKLPWCADIQIWNLAGDTQNEIINNSRQGFNVYVEAGYQSGSYGKIFDGQIFQPLFDRQNVTDFITTLNCINGFGIITANICSMTIEGGYDYAGIITRMAQSARKPIAVNKIADSMEDKKSVRGMTFYGDPRRYIHDICRDQNTQAMYDGALNIVDITEESPDPPIVVTPETGLIGTPQQIEGGISFKVLLNPQIMVKKPSMMVKIDNAIIRQQKIHLGQLISPLDQDGLYKVIKVVHTGGTRENDWYTEVVGVNHVFPVGFITSLIQAGYLN